jgi:hypothetical protein
MTKKVRPQVVRNKKRSTQSSEAASPINADYRMGTSNDNIPQESNVVKSESSDKLFSRSEQNKII